MADLKPVIRLKTHQLDQKKRALSILYKEREQAVAQKQDLIDALAKERDALRPDSPINDQMQFLQYSDNMKTRIAAMDEKLAAMDQQIAKAQDLMRASFTDLKKVEIIQERREDEERQAIQKKEDQNMDDIGLELHRRQKSSDSNGL